MNTQSIFREATEKEKEDYLVLSQFPEKNPQDLLNSDMRTQFIKKNRKIIIISEDPKKEFISCYKCWFLESAQLANSDDFEVEYKNYQRLKCKNLSCVSGETAIINGVERKRREFCFHYHCDYCQQNDQIMISEDLLTPEKADKLIQLTKSEEEF